MDWESEQRFAALDAQVRVLNIRHSAHAFVLETTVAAVLANDRASAIVFLRGLAAPGTVRMRDETGVARTPRPDDAQDLDRMVGEIAAKMAARLGLPDPRLP